MVLNPQKQSMKYTIMLILLLSCQSQKKIANYKVTPNGYEVYKRSKNGEPTKDVLSNGDTLVSTGTSIFIKKYIPKIRF